MSINSLEIDLIKRHFNYLISYIQIDPIINLLKKQEYLFESLFLELHETRRPRDKSRKLLSKIVNSEGDGRLKNLFIDALLATKQLNIARLILPEYKQNLYGIAINTETHTSSRIPSKSFCPHKDYNDILASIRKSIFVDPIIYVKINRTNFRRFTGPNIYRHSSERTNLALVINNEIFSPRSSLMRRTGSSLDSFNIQNMLRVLGYSVTAFANLSVQQMSYHIKAFAHDKNHCDSCIVVILSHGIMGRIYASDGEVLSIEWICSLFDGKSCILLRHKPKIFILQACRGFARDPGYSSSPTQDSSLNRTDSVAFCDDSNLNYLKLPYGSDMLICYTTLPGFVSWRNELLGTWFIRAFVHVILHFCCAFDLLTLLTITNDVVVQCFESSHGHKMICEFTSRLLKRFYFN